MPAYEALPPVGPKLTDEQADAIIAYAVAQGRNRARTMGAKFKEDDFLVGVMVALCALDRADKMPAAWVFGLMSGESPLDLDRKGAG